MWDSLQGYLCRQGVPTTQIQQFFMSIYLSFFDVAATHKNIVETLQSTFLLKLYSSTRSIQIQF